MDWVQVLVIVGSNLVMVFGIVGISASAYLHMDKKIDENRQLSNTMLKAIQDEMKDFHGRLCAIEEKNKGK